MWVREVEGGMRIYLVVEQEYPECAEVAYRPVAAMRDKATAQEWVERGVAWCEAYQAHRRLPDWRHEHRMTYLWLFPEYWTLTILEQEVL